MCLNEITLLIQIYTILGEVTRFSGKLRTDSEDLKLFNVSVLIVIISFACSWRQADGTSDMKSFNFFMKGSYGIIYSAIYDRLSYILYSLRVT